MDKDPAPTYLLASVALAAVIVVAAGEPLTALLPFALLLALPVLLIHALRVMYGIDEDHAGHGCEHDPTRKVRTPMRHQW